MVFDKEKLKKAIKEHGISDTEDLGAFLKKMTKEVVETLYEGELAEHLGYDKYENRPSKDNARNGYSKKTVKSSTGEITLNVPRDRQGAFDPKAVKKRQTDISGLETKVISMYAKGMSTRDIACHIEEIYGIEISPETISNMTNSISGLVKEWQSRPLKAIYPIVFMDAMMIKMRHDGIVQNVAIYAVLGIDIEGKKDCLGLYMSETESAKYWLSVMNELKNRGVIDIFIFAVDNLTGISEAIEAAFPKAEVQKCIVHQIRNSLKFVPWKERKQVANDLKSVYKAATEQDGLRALDDFVEKWDSKYPHISKSWRKNWTELATFFKYSPELRKLIYTTNPIESFNRGMRKVIKTKSVFPNQESVFKQLYLTVNDMSKKWTLPIRGWGLIFPQLYIYFEERLEKYI